MCFIFTATGAIAESTENALYGCIYSACWQFWHLRVYINLMQFGNHVSGGI